MTPYRGPRMRQISSQWEWEEEQAAKRAEAEAVAKLLLRRDYCWHRVGLMWEVRLSWLDDAGKAIYTEPAISRRFWSQRNAARVSNAIFGAYNEGRADQRKAIAPSPANQAGPNSTPPHPGASSQASDSAGGKTGGSE